MNIIGHCDVCGATCPHCGSRQRRREQAVAQQEARFWSKVEKDGPETIPGSPCWIWTGSRRGGSKAGAPRYGNFVTTTLSGEHINWGAHGSSWFLAHGSPVPKGLVIRHKCDTPLCVRPDHLLQGTQKDNIHDGIRRGRYVGRKTGWEGLSREERQARCKDRLVLRGEENPSAKFSQPQIEEVIRRAAMGEQSKDIAAAMEMSLSTVEKVRQGARWKHVSR